ncbi:MAG TPA: hypothetical protein VMW27_30405 [Thermoanaerobaculia bacterium]|nr:hypothetical protein [Thermoanaerobaculia bacterium]
MPDHRSLREAPPNAFSTSYLEALKDQDEPSLAQEAELEGPWKVVEGPEGWAVIREWESLESGAEPVAVLEEKERALIVAAVLGAVGRERLFELGKEAEPGGYPILSQGRVIGRMRRFSPEVVEAAHVGEAVLRSPLRLATLFQAAGPLVQEITGRLLLRALAEQSPAP